MDTYNDKEYEKLYRKWEQWYNIDQHMKPIVSPQYDIGLEPSL